MAIIFWLHKHPYISQTIALNFDFSRPMPPIFVLFFVVQSICCCMFHATYCQQFPQKCFLYTLSKYSRVIWCSFVQLSCTFYWRSWRQLPFIANTCYAPDFLFAFNFLFPHAYFIVFLSVNIELHSLRD